MPFSQEQLALDLRLEPFCQQFISHNLQSGNLGTLVEVYLNRVEELLSLSDQQNNVLVWQTFNALFIFRTLAKYMIETGAEFQLLQHFEARPVVVAATTTTPATSPNGDNTGVGNRFAAFVEATINLLVVIPVK